MPRPVNPPGQARQTRRTIRNLLAASYAWPEPPNRTYDRGDFVELAALAMGRGHSLAMASHVHPRLPDSDTFHRHLHGATADRIFAAFQVSLNGLLDAAGALGWLGPSIVAIYRHNEPVYGKRQPYMVAMKKKAGTTWGHAYLTSQRVGEPRLTLDVQRLHALRDQHAALADLLVNTGQRQHVSAYLLDKGFYNQMDLALLLATKTWFVVPVPLTKRVHAWADELRRTRTRVAYGRFVATRRHRVGDAQSGSEVVQVFVWEPDPDEPLGEALFVYACPQGRPLDELYEWSRTYRKRWGIETGYRTLEDVRLRTTTHVYANRLYLSLVAVLLDVAWRLVRHGQRRREAPVLTLPRFRLLLASEPGPLAA